MRQRRGLGCGCLGCGGGTLIVLGLLGALAWFFVIQPARNFLAGWQAPTTTQTQAPNTPGTPGAPAVAATPITRAEVEQFVRVRREVRGALGTSFTGIQQVWTDVQSGQTPNLLQVANVLRSAGSSVAAARTAQQRALAAQNMSAQRYATVRSAVNRALGLPTVDFARAAQDLQSGRIPNLGNDVQTATAQERTLIEPFRRELTATAAAGLLGL